MSPTEIVRIIREMKMASVSLDNENTAKMMQRWAEELWNAIESGRKPDTVDGLRWDFEMMMAQRDTAVNELNIARRKIDEIVSQQLHANSSSIPS
jgi:hypothetical protein